ncbi:hypothetical protein JOD24_000554 [Kroppenstedtia sanguinis]
MTGPELLMNPEVDDENEAIHRPHRKIWLKGTGMVAS